jgi:CheY-like chemotaxis protein
LRRSSGPGRKLDEEGPHFNGKLVVVALPLTAQVTVKYMLRTTTESREMTSSYNFWLVPAQERCEFCLPFIVHMEGCRRFLFAGNRGCLRPEALAASLEFVTSSIACCGIVIIADDGRKGFVEFKTGHFDLVFLNIFMPTMDGLEAMKLVRELRRATPIIAMSGRPLMPDSGSEPDFLAMATRLGAVRSLPKPFRPAALLSTLAQCLAEARESSAQPAPDRDVASRH